MGDGALVDVTADAAMSSYILLLTLTPTGRELMLIEPTSLLEAEKRVSVAGVEVLGLYAVLGAYDFVSIVEAPDNETVARFSLELGVLAGALIETLPTIPIGRLDPSESDPTVAAAAPLPEVENHSEGGSGSLCV